jgi:hypothetical protein
MLQGSLFGRAEGKRTINVHANLLGERLGERQAIALQVRRRLLMIAVTGAIAGLSLPGLFNLRAANAAQEAASGRTLSALESQLASLAEARDAAAPRIERSVLISRLASQCRLVLGQIAVCLNAVPATVACSIVKAEVNGGDLTIKVAAEAESFDEAQRFAKAASAGPQVKSALILSSKHSDALSPNGVAFEFLKRVWVGQ